MGHSTGAVGREQQQQQEGGEAEEEAEAEEEEEAGWVRAAVLDTAVAQRDEAVTQRDPNPSPNPQL